MISHPNERYKSFLQEIFKGMNADLSPEKLPPDLAQSIVNMQLDDAGVPETVNGCSLAKAVSDDILRIAYFSTRGEDYIFVYTGSNTIRIFKYPDYTEYDYDGAWTYLGNLTFTEPTWFAEHMGEFWFGNMADGVWRWSPGHQALRRGSAPLDITVEVGEDGEVEKGYTVWNFAYDYEYKGGRSPLSRSASTRLFSNTHTVKVIMDYPPDISRNRRIYAAYSTDDGATWSSWYFVKEEEGSSVLEVSLDGELVDRIDDNYILTEDAAKSISPRARMGVNCNGRLCLAYLVESPTIMRFYELGQPYSKENSYFDVKESITNIKEHGEYIVLSTNNKIYGLVPEPNKSVVLAGEGAYRNSLEVVRGTLLWVNSIGFRYLEAPGKPKALEGMNSIDFSGLQKEKRFHLWTSQQDFNQGTSVGGITSDAIPGALSLQPNLSELLGLEGMLCRQNNIGGVLTPTVITPYIWTSRDGYDYYAQPFKIITGDAGKYTLNEISLYMQANGTDERFAGEIRADDSGDPDMTTTGLLGTFAVGISRTLGDQNIELDEPITLDEDSQYWIVIPQQGNPGADFRIYYYNPDVTNGKEFFPQGEWLEYTDDDGATWGDYDPGGSDTIFLKFSLLGHGDVIITPNYLSDFEHGALTGESDEYAFAQKFIPNVDCTAERGEIIVYTKATDNGITYPTIEIQGDSSGEPDGVAVSTASAHSEDSDLMLFDFDGASLSRDTTYWLVVKKVGNAADYWNWGKSENQVSTETLRSTDYSTWTNASGGLWCKIFVAVAADAVLFATTGNWTSNEVEIGASDDFLKFYANIMRPTEADIKIVLSLYTDAWYAVTVYDSSVPTDLLPYNTQTTYPTATKAKVAVYLTLNTALYTPIVDSLLLAYEKDGDAGNLLHAGNVKGAYWVSIEDYDDDDTDEITYVLSKYGFWHELSEGFRRILPISEDVVLGIGKNPNETYENIYKLDDEDVSVWYSGDTTPIPIRTEWESGWVLYSHIVKQFRKLRIAVKGEEDAKLHIEVLTSGSELYSDGDTEYLYPYKVDLQTALKSFYISLNKYAQGKYIKFKFYAINVDWSLHNYELEYWELMRRNLANTHILSYPYFVFYRGYDDIEAGHDKKIHTLDLRTFTAISETLTSDYTIEAIQVVDNYLYISLKNGITASDTYLFIYLINSDGSLTIQDAGGLLISDYHSNQFIAVVKGMAILSGGTANDAIHVKSVDISDRTDPVIMATLSPYGKVNTMSVLEDMVLMHLTPGSGEDAEIQFRDPFTLVEVETAITATNAYCVIAVFPGMNLWAYSQGDAIYLMRGLSQVATIDEGDAATSRFVQMSWNPINNKLYTIYHKYEGAGNDHYNYLYVYNQDLTKAESLLLSQDADDNDLDAGVFCTIDGYTLIWYGDDTQDYNIILRRPDDTEVTELEEDVTYRMRATEGQQHKAGCGKYN